MGYLQDLVQLATLFITLPLLAFIATLSKLISLFKSKQPTSSVTEPKTILITGASSGIGKALALEYSNPQTTVIITGRNKQRLEEVKSLCEERGAKVITKCIDVRDAEEMKKFINEVDRQSRIDLIFANAGVNESQVGLDKDVEERFKTVVEVNVNGVLNTILPAIKRFQARKSGRIVIISSLASLCPIIVGVYGCAKSCISNIGSVLRVQLAKDNIKVNVVIPGWIDTPMADAVKNAPKRGKISPEACVKLIKEGMERDDPIIKFSWWQGLIEYAAGVLPFSLLERFNPDRSI